MSEGTAEQLVTTAESIASSADAESLRLSELEPSDLAREVKTMALRVFTKDHANQLLLIEAAHRLCKLDTQIDSLYDDIRFGGEE